MADIDLTELEKRLAQSVAKVKENGPQELKRQFAELNEQPANPLTTAVDPRSIGHARFEGYARGHRED